MKNKNLLKLAWPCLAAVVFALCLVFAGCGGGGEEKEEVPTGPDFAGLQTALTAAEKAKADNENVKISDNGTDVDTSEKWVTSTLNNALTRAINTAKDMISKKAGTTKQVNDQIAALEKATAEYLAGIKPGTMISTPPDYEGLENALKDAEEMLATASMSNDGLDIDADKQWVVPGVWGALNAAITKAKTMVNTAPAAAVLSMITELEEATQDFENGRAHGNGDSVPKIAAEIQVILGEVPGLKKYTEGGVEKDYTVKDSPVPGLFEPWGGKYVSKSANDLLDAEVIAAQIFVNDPDGTTVAEARAVRDGLKAAVDKYKASKQNGQNLVFIDVPAGRFTRYGGTATLTTTGHETRISYGYKVAKYPITIGQWEAVMGTDWPNDGSNYNRYDSLRSTSFSTADRERFPCVRLSWYDAIAFCNKLSLLLGKDRPYTVSNVDDDTWKNITATGIPSHRPGGWAGNSGGSRNNDWSNAAADWSSNGFRLPTEHEWQWAAMGAYSDSTATITGSGDARVNTTGYKKAYAGQPSSDTNDTGNGSRSAMTSFARVWWATANPANATTNNAAAGGYPGTRPVGQLTANELGICDMSGNVYEWCWDWCQRSGSSSSNEGSGNNLELPATGVQTDYKGIARPSYGINKIGHGGDWYNFADGSGGGTQRPSVWNRTGYYEYIGYDQSGFRLVTTDPTVPTEND